jgi:hypothetical protein
VKEIRQAPAEVRRFPDFAPGRRSERYRHRRVIKPGYPSRSLSGKAGDPHMPQAFLTFFGLITGFLNGAGLGALLLSYYPGPSLPEPQLLVIATLIIGPAGAVAGSIVAKAQTHLFKSEGYSEEG